MTDEPQRLFSLEEAREALPVVGPLLETLCDAHNAMEQLHDEVMSSVPTNGGGPAHRSFLDASTAASASLKELEAMQVVIRDPASGLVDFPTERDGEVVFLCWRLGEETVAWWHPTETGFAGRQPL